MFFIHLNRFTQSIRSRFTFKKMIASVVMLAANILSSTPLFAITEAAIPAATGGKILVIVSSESSMEMRGGVRYQTGYFLNELTIPVMALTKAGYEIIFANPKGNSPTLDKNSENASFFGNDEKKYREARAFHDNLIALKQPKKLSEVINQGLGEYRGVLFPGGHAPMQDLLADTDVATVLAHFHRHQKVTALICHGPIALLAAMPKAQEFNEALRKGDAALAKSLARDWPYQGYRMTVFSNPEEKIAEQSQLGGKMFFYPQDALTTAGGNVVVAKQWLSHVVVDRELITAQNPFSDDAFVDALLKNLAQKGGGN
jgi:putative intracellular protease/amidase